MPAYGLVEESTMNEYAAPYTPSMPFFTLPSNSEAPYSSYSATSIQPDVPSMYYYDSGYSPYVPYCPDFSTSSNPQFNQDWFVGSSVPPVSHDWYPENEDPAIPYYPAAPSFDNSGFYAYGSCHYPEQLHGDPLVSSTVITTTPWENCPPVSTAATTATDFYESLQTSSCDFYGGYENKEDKQSQKLQEEDNSTVSGGHYLDKIQRAGKSTESSMEVKLVQPICGFKHSHSPYTGLNVEASKSAESSERFKQVSSFWQENASTTVGMEHSHAMSTCLSSEADKVTECFKGFNFKRSNSSCQESDSTTVGMGSSHTMSTCFDFEGFPTISPQKDFGSNVQGPFSRKLQQSNELLEPLFGWTASYPADIPVPRANIALSRPMSSASSPLINWAASYSDDTPVSRPNFSLSRPIGSVSLSLESSLPTFFGNYDMYKSPMLLSSQSTTERAPTHVQESKGKAEDARGIKSNMEHCGNRQPVYEGKTTPETSFGCSIKTKKTIHSPATTEQAGNVLDFDMKPMPSASPSHCNDPSNCAIQSPDVPLMNDMLCNELSSFQEMDFHTKRMEDFLANCSKGGESADDALLIAKSDGSGSYPTQKHSAAYRHGHFRPTLDILSSDCHLPKPSWLFPTSLSESASSFSSSQFVDGSTSREVLGSSKLLHSSLIKTAPIVSAPQLLNESKGSEEIKACQSLPLGIDKTASVECTKVSFGNATGSLSENTKLRNDLSILSKEVVDPGKECHTLVHTMHNLSVVLLASSSSSDNIRESDFQVLQSAICNLSQCLVKRMGLSTSTVGTAIEPEKPMATPNIKRNQKAFKVDRRCSKVDDVVDFPRRELKEFVACSAVGGKEVPVERTNSFQISAEAMQSQMVNIEADLDLMKFEIRCLKMELEMERLRKSHEGALKFGHSEISANKNAVDSGISPDLNLGIKGNDSNHTAEPISQESGHGLPDLNLNPIRDSAVQTNATIKFEGILISQNKSHGESSLNSRASTSDQKTGQLNAETGNGQIEDPSGSKLNMGCMGGSDEGKMQCTNQSSLPESKDSSQLNGQHKVPSIIPASLEIGPYCTDGYELKSNNHIHSLQGSILSDNSPRERDSHLEGQNEVSFAKHTQIEILNSKDSNFFMDDRLQTGNIFVEGGATAESPTEFKSVICFREFENVNGMHISKEVPCSELDSGWQHINSNEEDHIYSSDEDSMFIF